MNGCTWEPSRSRQVRIGWDISVRIGEVRLSRKEKEKPRYGRISQDKVNRSGWAISGRYELVRLNSC